MSGFVTISEEQYAEYQRLAAAAVEEGDPSPSTPESGPLEAIDAAIEEGAKSLAVESRSQRAAQQVALKVQRQAVAAALDADDVADDVAGHPDIVALDERIAQLEERRLSGDIDDDDRRTLTEEVFTAKRARLRRATELAEEWSPERTAFDEQADMTREMMNDAQRARAGEQEHAPPTTPARAAVESIVSKSARLREQGGEA